MMLIGVEELAVELESLERPLTDLRADIIYNAETGEVSASFYIGGDYADYIPPYVHIGTTRRPMDAEYLREWITEALTSGEFATLI